ncbi:MAG: acylneuraminate cytidylyltransferase [Spirochaetes bacterium]|nr:acylneuraminate cytidylyltransferase [Spirochaetota bacterium]
MGRSGKIAVFLQARIASTRLPQKTLLQLGSMSIVSNAMRRLKKINANFHVLLTDNESFEALKKEAMQCNFDIMEGPGDDVLKRFTLAIEKYQPHTFIRATADNPLVFYKEAALILERHIEANADHSIFTGMPLGAGVEIVKAEKLLEAESLTKNSYDREHVTPYLYKNSAKYLLNHLKAPDSAWYPEGRITLDTLADYDYLKKIFTESNADNASSSNITKESAELIKWLKQNPHPAAKPADIKI